MSAPGVPRIKKPLLKVILVGASGVGKTSLIGAYFKQPFDNQTEPTVAPAYSSTDIKREDGIVVSLQIWDTAGQERFYSVSKLFFRDADVAFVCFEIYDKQSTDAIEEWIKRVKQEVPGCKIILVGTKSDLQTPESIEKWNETERPQIKEKYPDYDIILTSAVSKDGIQETFLAAAQQYKPKNRAQVQTAPVQVEKEKSKCC